MLQLPSARRATLADQSALRIVGPGLEPRSGVGWSRRDLGVQGDVVHVDEVLTESFDLHDLPVRCGIGR